MHTGSIPPAPSISLPNQEAEYVSHIALDIGGSLVKLVYFSPDPLEGYPPQGVSGGSSSSSSGGEDEQQQQQQQQHAVPGLRSRRSGRGGQ